MSNSRDDFSPVNRALVAGALVGATGSCIAQWKNYRSGEQSLNKTALNVARDAAKGAAIGGGVMAISRPGPDAPYSLRLPLSAPAWPACTCWMK
ncbi:hypothetical protein ACRS85_15535 [Pluralibacter gergoviae]|uniref:hypothetical protein n=1 Tax=Pluralibacter gergoviae TaxID=61647 RepID=UPI003EDF1BED